MRGKVELLRLIVGLVLFILDLVTDCYVADQYKRQGENAWFGLTLTFIIVPLIIVNFMALCQADSYRGNRFENGCLTDDDGEMIPIVCCCLFYFAMIDRYIQEFRHWKRKFLDNSPCGENYERCNCTDCRKYREIISESNESAHELAWIRYVETTLESIPQWCLQVYVMLSRWSFPWYTVLSSVIALLSLAWSNTDLEKTRANKDGHNFNMKSTVLYFISQLAVLAGRLFSIVMYAYVSPGAVFFLTLAVFWFYGSVLLALLFCGYMMFSICCGNRGCSEPSTKTMCKNFILTIPLTFYVSETVLESLGFTSILIKMFLFATKSFENMVMLLVVLAVARSKPSHLDILMPIAWSLLVIGFSFGLISLIARHALKVLERREAPAEPDANTTEAQTDAYHMPESGTISATNNAFAMH